ncbi:hypothetical protein BYT27DRAFT_7194004 [Phlegmacium glaucopus]|nr:hypothetical protein BYT27DRAFT_7194004 [Phlegmacium glaucopus]
MVVGERKIYLARHEYIIQSVLESFDFKVVNKSVFFLNSGNILFTFQISVHDVLDPFLASESGITIGMRNVTMRVSLNRSCCFSPQTISSFNSAPTDPNISSFCYASTKRFSASCDSCICELVSEFSEFGLKLRQEKFEFSVTFFEVSDEFRVFFAWKLRI